MTTRTVPPMPPMPPMPTRPANTNPLERPVVLGFKMGVGATIAFAVMAPVLGLVAWMTAAFLGAFVAGLS